MSDQNTRTIELKNIDPRLLFGSNHILLKSIESSFDAQIVARGDTIWITGTESALVETLFYDLFERLRLHGEISEQYLSYAISFIKESGRGPATEMELSSELSTVVKLDVRPRTVGQKAYIEAIEKYDIVFGIGPAGTGKTYLAVAEAVAGLKNKLFNRIILVRPAVEAGESLGFLPGDIRAKVDPYLRPVYDALHDMLPADKIKKLMELGVIEIVPLAFMRGRTLNSSFAILDEAQNTTVPQMKMFLTRIGEGSKAVVTGDVTQIDLDRKRLSGLIAIQKILRNISDVKFCYLTDKDVVRHRLVKDIIRAFERYEEGRR
ncbi:MAG: PhoH family protein [candidate division Zixibacteria bacterium]|nr:PhoH family protein [candidate division Zixibacteria bacterium]